MWICTHPSKAWEYTITKYAMQETNLQGKAQAAREEYDLLVPVMVCLGKEHYFIMRVTKLPAERVREIAAPHGYVI